MASFWDPVFKTLNEHLLVCDRELQTYFDTLDDEQVGRWHNQLASLLWRWELRGLRITDPSRKDLYDLVVKLAPPDAWERAILARREAERQLAQAALEPQPPAAAEKIKLRPIPFDQLPKRIEAPPELTRAEQIDQLRRAGQEIMARLPPEEWVAAAQKIVRQGRFADDLGRAFLKAIAARANYAVFMRRFRKDLAGAHAEREGFGKEWDQPSLTDRMIELAAAMRDVIGGRSPERLTGLLRALIDALPDMIPDVLLTDDVKQFVAEAQETLRGFLDFIDALPEEARELVPDLLQLVLDLVGLIPGAEIADAASGYIDLERGDYFSVGMSIGAMLPIGGQFAGLGKIWARVMKLRQLTAKIGGGLKLILLDLFNVLFAAARKLQPSLASVRDFFRQLRAKLRELIGKMKESVTRSPKPEKPKPKNKSKSPIEAPGSLLSEAGKVRAADMIRNLRGKSFADKVTTMRAMLMEAKKSNPSFRWVEYLGENAEVVFVGEGVGIKNVVSIARSGTVTRGTTEGITVIGEGRPRVVRFLPGKGDPEVLVP